MDMFLFFISPVHLNPGARIWWYQPHNLGETWPLINGIAPLIWVKWMGFMDLSKNAGDLQGPSKKRDSRMTIQDETTRKPFWLMLVILPHCWTSPKCRSTYPLFWRLVWGYICHVPFADLFILVCVYEILSRFLYVFVRCCNDANE